MCVLKSKTIALFCINNLGILWTFSNLDLISHSSFGFCHLWPSLFLQNMAGEIEFYLKQSTILGSEYLSCISLSQISVLIFLGKALRYRVKHYQRCPRRNATARINEPVLQNWEKKDEIKITFMAFTSLVTWWELCRLLCQALKCNSRRTGAVCHPCLVF